MRTRIRSHLINGRAQPVVSLRTQFLSKTDGAARRPYQIWIYEMVSRLRPQTLRFGFALALFSVLQSPYTSAGGGAGTTMLGSSGFLGGGQGAAVELLYVGNNQFARISFVPSISILTGASDNASDPAYNSGWSNTSDGGSGLGQWSLTTSGGGVGSFLVSDSSLNGSGASGNINTPGKKARGIAASGGNLAQAQRPFNASLQPGQTFKLNVDTGTIDPGGKVGFALLSAGATRLEFYFSGGDTVYRLNDASGGSRSTGIGLTDGGLHLEFSLTGTDSYSLLIAPAGSSVVTLSGSLLGSGAIDSVQLYNNNAGTGASHYAFFDSLQIVP